MIRDEKLATNEERVSATALRAASCTEERIQLHPGHVARLEYLIWEIDSINEGKGKAKLNCATAKLNLKHLN